MKYWFEPINTLHWNMFEKVHMPNHVEPFLAVKAMETGDVVLLHVGAQDKRYPSGIYAWGTVIRDPYILHDSPEDYCNERLTVDVRIDRLTSGIPFMPHKDCKEYIRQFRTVHGINKEHQQVFADLIRENR